MKMNFIPYGVPLTSNHFGNLFQWRNTILPLTVQILLQIHSIGPMTFF